MRVCGLEDCGREYRAKGFCYTHYDRNRKGMDLSIPIRVLHGKSGSSEYETWEQIIQRCTNPRDINYIKYGGRGITVCERWLHSFIAFYEDMGERPSKSHSLDRIDNSLGYFKENCRWTTWSVQNINKRPRKNKSGYTGVRSNGLKWQARFCQKHIGTFDTKLEASQAYQEARTKYLQEVV